MALRSGKEVAQEVVTVPGLARVELVFARFFTKFP